MDFSKFIEWCFYLIVSGGVSLIASAAWYMKSSIDELNIKLATVIEKTSSHERALEAHDDRIRELEKAPCN